MRPLLRPDAYLAESEDGAYLLTHRGPVHFTGRSVHRFIERLSPYLDGSRTLDELTAGLAQERADAVRKLVGMLLDRDVVRDADLLVPADADRPEITYLGYFDNDPARAFERYQGMRALVLGEGPVASAVARAAERSGLRDVATSVNGSDVDFVLHVTSQFGRAEEVEQRYPGWRAQVVLHDGYAWLGVSQPGEAEVWSSARRRLAAWHPSDQERAVPGAAAVAVVASRLVHSAFRAITALDSPRPGRLVRVDLTTLDDSTHTIIPHPLARSVASGSDSAAEIDPEIFSQRAATWTDDVIGSLGEPSERDLAQIPLRVCEVSVSDPVGLLGNAPAPVVTGVGLDFATARYRAALRAFALYGALMLDRRRVRDGHVTGYALESMEPVPVPVSLAFPVLTNAAVPSLGAAAGYSRSEALEAGLVEHCRQLTVDERQPRRRVDLGEVSLDASGERYRAMLAAIGRAVTVYDITGSLGVPTFLCFLDDEPAGCAARLDSGAALTDTLEQAVLHYQAPAHSPNDHVLTAEADPATALPVSIDLATAVQALIRAGHRPVAVPLDHDQEMSAIVPHTFQVVLLND